MKVLVVYDTVSPARVTGKVAEILVAGLHEKGVNVDSFFIDDAGKADPKDYDCLVLGAPTMAWKPSQKMKGYLAGLQGKSYAGKLAATFDTQLKSAISGNATKHMDQSLTAAGFNIAVPDLIAYVKTENKQYRLLDGEEAKIKNWAYELAKVLK